MTTYFAPAIRKAHFRAELQRLNEGWPGCGCADCQELYKALDHSRYGSRVTYLDGIVIFGEDSRLHKDTVKRVTVAEVVSPVTTKGVTAPKRHRTALDAAILTLSRQGLGCRQIADRLFAQGLGDHSYRTIARHVKKLKATENA